MHDTTFITLGTAGGPVPKVTRSAPCHAVTRNGRTILVDCGEGAMRQLKKAGIDFRNVHDIILTHHHFDHIGSLFTCLGINMMMQRTQPLTIYGPKGTKRIVDALAIACDVPCEIGFGVSGQELPNPRKFLQVRELAPGESTEIGDIAVSCCENTHYRNEEHFGSDGPISLSLRFDAPDRSIVFTGDTGPSSNVGAFSTGADLLVGEMIDFEATMEGVRRSNPHMTAERIDMMGKHLAEHHLIPEALGDLATRAGVGQVVAVHMTLDSINAETAPAYIARVQSRYGGAVTIADDLDRF
ncbi:MAG: MBL fold metallo-hydrolase [Pseudomonadota bacterium]